MGTKRLRLAPRRINQPVPQWAQRLLVGERPPQDTDAGGEFFGWMFLGDDVPGLPPADTDEGAALVELHHDDEA